MTYASSLFRTRNSICAIPPNASWPLKSQLNTTYKPYFNRKARFLILNIHMSYPIRAYEKKQQLKSNPILPEEPSNARGDNNKSEKGNYCRLLEISS